MNTKKYFIGAAAIIIIGMAIYMYYIYTNAPEGARNGFAQKFPDMASAGWMKESANEWEAEFDMNGEDYAAIFTEDGTWVRTEHEIEEKDLPEKVWNLLNEKFKDYRIDEIEYVENADSSTGYNIELEKDEELRIFISSEGELVSLREE